MASCHLPLSTAVSLSHMHMESQPLSFRNIIVPHSLRNRRRFLKPSETASLPIRRFSRATDDADSKTKQDNLNDPNPTDQQQQRRGAPLLPAKASFIVAACAVGLLTGIAVVLFNNAVHGIRDFFWDGIPSRGTSWLREEPIEENWQRVILVPVCGGVLVGMLNLLQNALQNSSSGVLLFKSEVSIEPIFKALAASITLGTGNSLGPEGPSVEIGASIAKGVSTILRSEDKSLSLAAAGSAAGISSGFNASVAGCFFAVESVLWPSPADASASLTNSTSMVILSAVIASVVSEVGLGPVPAFNVPEYDFRTPSELPLYLLLGILCGSVSLILTRCTSYAREVVEYVHKASGLPKSSFPALGGLVVGVIALYYPEVLYWGFENVDILLESRPFVKGLSADLLCQLVGVKIIATSLCRASGLVGGYYAPSLFIGAATGVAYGKFMADILSSSNPLSDLSGLEVASPQAYGLVGMAATLAGVCQLPLTSVLLLFELTQDYRIVLPLLGAVGISSWITSLQYGRDPVNKIDNSRSKYSLPTTEDLMKDSFAVAYVNERHELESSVCVYDLHKEKLEENLTVLQAMQTRYATVLLSSSLAEAVSLMLIEKQSCVLIVNEDNFLIGLLAVEDIQDFCYFTSIKEKQLEVDKLLVSEYFNLQREKCQAWSVSPEETLLSARRIMDLHGVSRLPVVSKQTEHHRGGYLVGLLDRQNIDIACRVAATKELLDLHDRSS